jgi:hypothetical protein
MMLFVSLCLAGIPILFLLHQFRKYSSRQTIPQSVLLDHDMINTGIIPSRLTHQIPMEYQEREDYKMSSSIDTIFVDGSLKPFWCLVIKLASRKLTTETIVLYDNDGEIYDY